MSNSTPQHPEDELAHASREDIMAALFANMVIQQTNMAMMLLGKVAHPETGKIVQDFDAAKMFIDQLEMLETKTKGNLSKQEEGLLKQALAALHMAFVEAVEGTAAPQSKQEKPPERAAAPKPDAAQEASSTKPLETPADAAADDSRKRFSKKY
ncbi:MAG TPA: DUF1844 domain-containing protein [Verrucomicrobiae bacterium]|nr:DUF1844 domain-containing protein [Verrucomicrobiae bacterium]